MVGAAGIVASTINNRHQRRESRVSQHGGDEHNPTHHRVGSRATISDSGGGGSRAPSATNPSYTYTRSTSAINTGPLATSTGGGGLTNGATPKQGGDELEIVPEKLSFGEQVKFYVSLGLGIVASLCLFALLFLIPLVVEPSISTLLADFEPQAATCVTVDYTLATGLSKCGLWSSCSEGCTSTPSQCHQIYVSYRKRNKPGYPRIYNFTILDPHEWLDESKWDVSYTQLLVNAKGCGYPLRVKCDDFGDTYGTQGRTFPCYFSRANPRLVVTDYNWEEAAQPLLLSLCLPTGLFTISIAILSFWYCPSCEERGKNKRPCRSQYQTARAHDIEPLPAPRNNSAGRGRRRQDGEQNQQPQPLAPPIVQQPRGKNNNPNNSRPIPERSPSLATISSRDTTVSSVNSMDDGWQSPPSPPPRINPRMNASKSNLTTRTRKL